VNKGDLNMWNVLKGKVDDNDFSIIFLFIIVISLTILTCAEYKAINTPKNISSYYLITREANGPNINFQYIIKGNIPWYEDIYCYRTFDKKDAFKILKLLNENYIETDKNKIEEKVKKLDKDNIE